MARPRADGRSPGRLTVDSASLLEVYSGCMPQDPDARPIDPRESDERPPVVLGAELAKATAAEARHREAALGPSPLGGVEYDASRGEVSLFRFVESPTDEIILRFIDECRRLGSNERAEVRSSLTMEDFYTLLNFRSTARAADAPCEGPDDDRGNRGGLADRCGAHRLA